MLRILRHLQKDGFILNGEEVTPAVRPVLERLVNLGLIDPGYEGNGQDKPDMWVGNGNGPRVLRHLEASASLQAALDRKLQIHPRAYPALSSLSEWDQAKILAAVEMLQPGQPDSWNPDDVVRLYEDQPIYLLRVSPELRAFVRILDSEEIELLDIVREEALQLFQER
jgi:hypothetical protein